MANKINQKQTVLSVYKSVANRQGTPKYAFATPYEEGPEFGVQNGEGTLYNKPVGILLSKLFHFDINLMSGDGDAILDSLYLFILERVGRNRSYTRADVRSYLRKAATVYAAMRAAQGCCKIQRDIPGFALHTSNESQRMWKEFYEDRWNTVNIKYPLPATIANWIDEYVVPYLEDKKGAFEKPFAIALQALEVYDDATENSVEFQFVTEDTSTLSTFINRPLSSNEASFARDVETCLVTKKLPNDPYAAPVYPLDTKHRCDLINITKGSNFAIDANVGIKTAEGNKFNVRSIWTSDKIFAAVSHKENVEAKSIILAPCYNSDVYEPADNRVQSPVAIDRIKFVTMTGEDDEDFPADLIVDAVNQLAQLDEFMIAVNYADLFGGLGFAWTDSTAGASFRAVQIDSYYTYAFGLTEANVNAIRSQAVRDIFDFELITDSKGRNSNNNNHNNNNGDDNKGEKEGK